MKEKLYATDAELADTLKRLLDEHGVEMSEKVRQKIQTVYNILCARIDSIVRAYE